MGLSKVENAEWDMEAQVMNTAILYMEQCGERARERFIFHLVHRFYPDGIFDPKAARTVGMSHSDFMEALERDV